MFSCYLITDVVYILLVCVCIGVCFCLVFFFKQKTAYEMRISDWSSDVCSSDLAAHRPRPASAPSRARLQEGSNAWWVLHRPAQCPPDHGSTVPPDRKSVV